MRLGRIGYINCYPVYGAIDRGVIPLAPQLVTGTPSELNDLLAAGELDLSVVSAVEYARHARDYVLLPDLAISCDGPVRSVALFSKRTVGQLDGGTVLLTVSSRTAVALLELLCLDVWRVRPHFAEARAEARPGRARRVAARCSARHRGRGAGPGGARHLPAPLRSGRGVEAVDGPAVRLRGLGGAAVGRLSRRPAGARGAARVSGLGTR